MSRQQYSLTLDEFRALAAEGNLIPLYREILADYETPVSAFAKIDHGPTAYLLESVAGGENWARYSFLGSGSSAVIREEKGDLVLIRGKKNLRIQSRGNPLERLRELMEEYRPVTVPGLPRFVGGAVGYFSYDMVRTFEDLPALRKDSLGMPDFAFLLTDTLLIFDNVSQKIKVVANAYLESTKERDIRDAYRHATARIEKMIARLKRPVRQPRQRRRRKPITFTSNMNKADFEKMVTRTKEYIRSGDIVQAVLSQRWETQIHTTPFQLYRALRVINPSPYMYYLRVAGVELVGSSPETLVRCEDGQISLRPIAGTRRRGQTPEEDQDLARQLLADEKERAEHVMLVDLGRNDVGRVAARGSVKVESLMQVERYSHVMHIVSQVTGQLEKGKSVYDVMRACFPAGTVSGAPKIRAMEIIEELEPTRRGPYAGAVGYFGFSGNMDMCINIRTVVIKGRQAYIQAGAGIVADSIPEHEYEETCNKARAMMKAIELAEQGLE
ncbi:MAG: anthranilate synthase component I [Nitrospira sp.]|jgi:anthranilate synthase component 1|uniref:anthranilate synthase component I n=1 Tax=Nitrospira sp. ND1 TaxID=1658518 RepID=UPI0009BA493D|nr:anthranilate synthase component I [Nitrospira sp. ND1]MBK7420154.1 anthranilate synthase component I [Nitrospira sp.]OYT23068.1 MAG: anthranilate synthase component I [Nitrospira sp. UW-LDO-02]MBK7487765.1 anthranilate synthase component I [Nitrospira sp.]MBK9111566.1 anthranilate synthase component I [Nitrospira sp.]MBK9999125.1 anthranilate synthase component I [Nitrospira sp.]